MWHNDHEYDTIRYMNEKQSQHQFNFILIKLQSIPDKRMAIINHHRHVLKVPWAESPQMHFGINSTLHGNSAASFHEKDK